MMSRRRSSEDNRRLKRAAKLLRERMTERGMKPTELATELRVADSVVSRLLSGEREPSLRLAMRIEHKLGLPGNTWVDVNGR
jgi:plasmid maintenance system antidote protein VapI